MIPQLPKDGRHPRRRSKLICSTETKFFRVEVSRRNLLMTTRHPSIPQEMIEERNSKGRLFAQFFQSEYQFRGREVPREEENFLPRNPFFRDSLTILETENGDRGQFLAAEFSDREREILYPSTPTLPSISFL